MKIEIHEPGEVMPVSRINGRRQGKWHGICLVAASLNPGQWFIVPGSKDLDERAKKSCRLSISNHTGMKGIWVQIFQADDGSLIVRRRLPNEIYARQRRAEARQKKNLST